MGHAHGWNVDVDVNRASIFDVDDADANWTGEPDVKVGMMHSLQDVLRR